MALQLKNHQTKILPDRNSKQTHSSSSTPGGIKSKDFLCFPGGKCKVKPISSHVRDLIYLHFHGIIKSCFLLSPTPFTPTLFCGACGITKSSNGKHIVHYYLDRKLCLLVGSIERMFLQ